MRLSREKMMRLSHVVTDVLVASEDVEFIEDRTTIRQNVVEILLALLKEEEQVDTQVRQKIASQKKEILEGSEEWEVLYRKYYSEEMRQHGHRPPDHRHLGSHRPAHRWNTPTLYWRNFNCRNFVSEASPRRSFRNRRPKEKGRSVLMSAPGFSRSVPVY